MEERKNKRKKKTKGREEEWKKGRIQKRKK